VHCKMKSQPACAVDLGTLNKISLSLLNPLGC
jgi:hypothetical protein